MKRRPYRIPSLVTSLLGLILAASASAQVVAESGTPHTKTLKLDHFWCYIVSKEETANPAVSATLKDQFQTASDISVGTPLQFCNPAQKTAGGNVTPIVNLNDHLTMYNLPSVPLPASQTLTATNQFGAQQLTVDHATTLMVPTQKMLENLRFPTRLDHFLCYPVGHLEAAVTVDRPDGLADGPVSNSGCHRGTARAVLQSCGENNCKQDDAHPKPGGAPVVLQHQAAAVNDVEAGAHSESVRDRHVYFDYD